MMTKKEAIKKQLRTIKQEEPTASRECALLLAMLQNIGRDLLTVQDYENTFNVELKEI